MFHHNRTLGPFLQSIGSVLLRVVVDAHMKFFNALYRNAGWSSSRSVCRLPAWTGVHPQQIARITFALKAVRLDH